MEGAPAGMGDWGIKRVFHEAGRLLSIHLGDFLPIILVFIFPASLIKALHTQYFKGSSYFREPTSFWLLLLLGLFLALPIVLMPTGFVTMAQVLRDSIYTTDLKAELHSQSLYTRVKLAFTIREVDKTGASYERFRKTSKGKMLKAISATALCLTLSNVVISLSGTNFTPEAVAAMGLPPWTIILFTLLIVTVTTVSASYILLVGLVMCIWTLSPKTPSLM